MLCRILVKKVFYNQSSKDKKKEAGGDATAA